MQTEHSEFTAIGELLTGFSKLPAQVEEEQSETVKIKNKTAPVSEWLREFGVPFRSRGCTFLEYETPNDGARHALEVARALANELCSLQRREVRPRIFCGNPGTGKTHLACAVISMALRSGRQSRYLTASDIARSVRSSYSKGADATEEVILGRLVAVPFLVIDEIGKGLGSPHETAMIHDTITKRYEAMAPTLLISNLGQKVLAEYLDERIMDRFREDNAQIVEFLWESKRKAILREKLAGQA